MMKVDGIMMTFGGISMTKKSGHKKRLSFEKPEAKVCNAPRCRQPSVAAIYSRYGTNGCYCGAHFKVQIDLIDEAIERLRYEHWAREKEKEDGER